MEFLIGLASLWVGWLLCSRRWRRRLMLPFIALAVGLVIMSPLGLNLMLMGLTAPLPKDSGEQVDAIVILGRGSEMRDRRVVVAQELWQANRAPKVFASGRLDAQAIVEDLQAIGLPGTNLAGEECSQSTQENALFSAMILRPQKVKTILLVTDEAHMLRALLTFRSFQFRTIPVPVTLQPFPQGIHEILFREYVGLVAYGLTGKLKSQLIETDVAQFSKNAYKIQSWDCQVKGKVEQS